MICQAVHRRPDARPGRWYALSMGTFSSKRRVATTNRGYASLGLRSWAIFPLSLQVVELFVSFLLRQLVHLRLMHELAAYTHNLKWSWVPS